jgi:hypothetical protein
MPFAERRSGYPGSMSPWCRVSIGLSLVVGFACSQPATTELPTAERFNWSDQPVRFSPAPEDWRREKTTDGGRLGLRFVKTGSVGERIVMAEVYRFGRRDRCAQLDAMIAVCRELDWRSFTRFAQKARIDVRHPINDRERSIGEQVNDSLDRARGALLAGDRSGVCRNLELAREQAGWIRYSLDDVDEETLVVFRTGGLVRAEQFQPVGRSRTEVAGEPAARRDYTFEHRNHLFHGREVFVMHNNRLFVAAFHGLEENLPLFELMVDSIVFPPGPCRH